MRMSVYNALTSIMKFYIVTPAFNSLKYLQRCVRSVADQVCPGVSVHHHVQDGASVDGTAEWLSDWKCAHDDKEGYTLTFESVRDKGMYDAINKAWAILPQDADITAHLNSDEQYLPFALKQISEKLQSRLDVDIVITSYVVVDENNQYICHRRPTKPWRWISSISCEIMTCACFHRVSTFKRHGIRFDDRWKSLGDLAMYREVVNTCPRFLTLPNVWSSVFSVTGNNLGWSEITHREWPVYVASLPFPLKYMHKIAVYFSNFKRRYCDWTNPNPDSYEIYPQGASNRKKYSIDNPTAHWGCRANGEDK